MDDEILRYYDEFDEHSRLAGDSIEKLRTKELVSRYISGKNLRILDMGGGTGVYSFWLGSHGHCVHLVDPSPKHIRLAEEISSVSEFPLASASVGEARTIQFEDETFDAVLMLGPLYHLPERADRIEALHEAMRVMKSGATIVCAAISKYASMIDGFLYGYVDDPDYVRIVAQDLENGQHRNAPGKKYFTTAFFHLPEELRSELEDGGFSEVELFAVESVSELIPNVEERMKETDFQSVLLNTIRSIEQDEAFMGMTAHILGVAIKP